MLILKKEKGKLDYQSWGGGGVRVAVDEKGPKTWGGGGGMGAACWPGVRFTATMNQSL